MSKYERAQREAERKRRQEEWEATQEQKENEAIDVEDLKQQEDMKQGNYLESRMFDIDPKKHKAQQKQGKIRTIAEQGATEGERAAGQGKLKDQTQLPPILESREMDEIYAKDKADNKEFDEAVARGDLKEGVKIRQAGKFARDVWEDTKEFKHWSNLPHNIGAVGARGVESFFTIDANNPKEVALELIQKVGNPRKGLAGEIIGEIPGVKVAIRQIKKEAFDFAKRIMPNGYQAKYAMAGGGEIVEEAAEQTAKAKPLQMTGSGGKAMSGPGELSAAPIQRFMSNRHQRNVLSSMKKYGMGDGVFRLQAYDSAKGAYRQSSNRAFLENFLSPEQLKASFRGFKKANKESFQRIWGEFLQAKGLKNIDDIQAHHINSLYDSLHLYDGIKWNSPEYWDLTATLLGKEVSVGSVQRGDKIKNLMMTMGKAADPDTPHGIAHKLYNDITPTFFSKAEMKKIREVPGYRIKKAEQWAGIVKKSEDAILEAHRVWEVLNPKITMSFDELVDEMSKLDNLGLNKAIEKNYQVPDIQNIVLEIVTSGEKKGRKTQLLNTLKRLFPDVDPNTGNIQGNIFDKK